MMRVQLGVSHATSFLLLRLSRFYPREKFLVVQRETSLVCWKKKLFLRRKEKNQSYKLIFECVSRFSFSVAC